MNLAYESMMDVMIDFSLIMILVSSFIYGYLRHYRDSLMALLVQIFTLLSAYTLTIMTCDVLLESLEGLNVLTLLPGELPQLLQPFEQIMVELGCYLLLFILYFILIKSFTSAFLEAYLKHHEPIIQTLIHPVFDSVLSAILSVSLAYTYVLPPILVMGFPVFNIVNTNTFAHQLIESRPIFIEEINTMYSQTNALEDVIQTYGDQSCEFYDEQSICLNRVMTAILNGESTFNDFIPLLATEEIYIELLGARPITEVVMLEHVQWIQKQMDLNIFSNEDINLYYKMLIDNETYDKLIKNQIVLKTSIPVLLDSGLLDDENYNKLKEYL